ncbi:SpoIID/LytB domain-containing protein [Jatrophihabitans telluris]|uniref:SpoIID/LytB domain-containing protein n=1 Tax=Jatrophihabitans telluris TaxID=2038343 RepID=A0ABY4QW33_9ACTN|nr:SpoIID/LytB domain-containing protein [Jatrophihabitans telluris]UQX87553.1 SpoIID/LytB domain-containing protein [Jatrophihabitans telluris]
MSASPFAIRPDRVGKAHRLGRTPRQRAVAAAVAVLSVAGLSFASFTPQSSAAGAEYLKATAPGSWTIVGNGNGHGHGLSQYGARGAAGAGLTYQQILAFYYPGTSLAALAGSSVRVGLTSDGAVTTIGTGAGLTLSWSGGSKALSVAGASRWRLTPSGSGFAVAYLSAGAWHTSFTVAATSAAFSASSGRVRRWLSDGSSTVYRGTLGAVRSGAGEITVNKVGLDDYVRGVVPREMPSSWQAAAVQAQAVAARSYARYAVEHNASNSYDICDTTSCQVYAGKEHDAAGGGLVYGEETGSEAAVVATAGRVLRYGSSTIFAQFSASNGGWTTDGGQPYLVAKADPYEASSGDPYLGWSRTVSQRAVASYYGLSSLAKIVINTRDGHGQWGGRITAATVYGTGGGQARSVSTTGFELADAMNIPQAWFAGTSNSLTGHLDSVVLQDGHTAVLTGWVWDPASTAGTGRVHTYVDGTGKSSTSALARPDVQASVGSGSDLLGFSVTMPVPNGAHKVCAFAAASGQSDVLLGCVVLTASDSPIGQTESVTRVSGHPGGAGTVRFSGWTFDPNLNGGPNGRVHVYVGAKGYSFAASSARPDIQSRYHLAGNQVGFSVPVAVPTGRHQICVFGINVAGAGSNRLLSCRTIG